MAACDKEGLLQPGIAALPPLPGDELDLEWLEARALARREASCQLRTVLSATGAGALRDAGVGSSPSSPRADVSSCDWEPSVDQAQQLVRYVAALRQPAVELLERWDADVLGTVPSGDGASTMIFQDLRRSREARAVANHQLQACVRRKGAAAASLDQVLALRQQEEEEEAAAQEAAAQQEEDGEGDEEEDTTANAADDTEEKKKKKKHKGWGKKLMHKMGGGSSRSKSAHKKEAAEKEKEAAQQQLRAVEQVAEVKVRQSDETLQAAQDELVECVEELQDATEEMDQRTEQCLDTTRSLVQKIAREESGHRRGVREAVREAALALEEWACEAGAAVMELKIANASSAIDSDPALTLSTAEGPDASSNGSDSGLEFAGTGPLGGQLSAAQLEELAAKAARENDALQQSLPSQRQGSGGRGSFRDLERQLGVRDEEDHPGGDSDSDASDSSAWSRESLSEILRKNMELERAIPAQRAYQYMQKLRRSSFRLGSETSTLEQLTTRCSSAVDLYLASGGACSSTAPPATWQTQTSLGYTPTSAAPTSSDFLPEELLDAAAEEDSEEVEQDRTKRKRRGVLGKLRRAAGRAAFGSSSKHGSSKQSLVPPLPSSATEDPSEGSGQEQRLDEGLASPPSARSRRSQSAPGAKGAGIGASDAEEAHGAAEGLGRSPDLEMPTPDLGVESPEESEWWRDSGTEGSERPVAETNPFQDETNPFQDETNPFQDETEEQNHAAVRDPDVTADHFALASSSGNLPSGDEGTGMGPEVAISIPIPTHQDPIDDGSKSSAELTVERALAAGSMETALQRSDAALHRGRTCESGSQDPTEWQWEDYATEEMHWELHRSSQCMATSLTEEGWKWFAYELLLLLPSVLVGEEEVLGHLRSALPVLRIALGVTTNLHQHLAELTLPDGSQSYSPLDVRFRAALLLRAWARAEVPCLSMEIFGGADPAVRKAWIQRQLALLRGSVLLRLAHLHQEGLADSATQAAALACAESLDVLDGVAEAGEWGQPPCGRRGTGDASGRRVLLQLLKQMDVLGPSPGGEWRFHTIVAAKVFSLLWRAAADPEAADGLSFDAPGVAAALLAGLHPFVGNVPLQMETHAVLLAQTIWVEHSAGRFEGGAYSAGALLATQCVSSAAGILSDFGQWLHCAPVNMARCFARARGVPESDLHDAEMAELIARRVLTVELRDGLVRALRDYQNHLEPEAFPRALALWRGSHQATLLHATEEGVKDKAFIRGMGRWLIWSSVSAAAERSLTPFDAPPQLPLGDAGAFRRAGPMIKKHIEGLAEALERLTNELESERKYYNPAWEQQELGEDHLSVSATALARASLPRVDLLVKSGVWPSKGTAVADMPAAGGRLLKVLEATDRAARRWGDPRGRQADSLIDILLPHARAALEGRLSELERDITSSALKGDDDEVFQPSWPPTLLHCEGVITLWRFTHEALDSPLNLGVPVDIIVEPYLQFLEKVLHGARNRLVRPCESERSFRLARRAEALARDVASGDFDADAADFAGLDASGGGEAEAAVSKAKRKSRSRMFFKSKSSSSKLKEGAGKNVILEADLLQVDPQVTSPTVQQVTVRLNSIGFCLTELDAVYKKLKEIINTGDDSDNPTQRHNQARCLIGTEFPELQDTLQDGGHVLVKYLAARLVYWEMRQDLFERLYCASGDAGAASAEESEPGCLTMEALLARKRDSLLGLANRMPAHLFVMFVTDLGRHLSNAWTYVVMDYLRRSKAESLQEYIDDDQEALRQLMEVLIDVAKEHEDGEGAQRALRECSQRAEMLMIKVSSGTTEQLAAFAARAFEEGQETLAVPSQGGGGRPPQASPPRSVSPALQRPTLREASSSSPSPRRVNFAASSAGHAAEGATQKEGEERGSKKRKSIVKGLKGLAKFGGRSGKHRSNADVTEDAAALDSAAASA